MQLPRRQLFGAPAGLRLCGQDGEAVISSPPIGPKLPTSPRSGTAFHQPGSSAFDFACDNGLRDSKPEPVAGRCVAAPQPEAPHDVRPPIGAESTQTGLVDSECTCLGRKCRSLMEWL